MIEAFVLYERDWPKGVWYSLEEAAEELGVKVSSLKFICSPAHKKRINTSKGRVMERVVLDD